VALRPIGLRANNIYSPTQKELPAEAEIASHRLMLRAGLIRKCASGIYSFLPLGYRSLKKIEQIIREEMDEIGCQEVLLPIVQPAELWHESGRWAEYGPELARLSDRGGRHYCLGPTHEEIITSLVRNEIRSYRQLPVSLYQINMKFRDELRPRFGLLRCREFVMKDAYSFHTSQESLEEHYEAQKAAYGRICDRLSLKYRPVQAESGQIGGNVTTEFMALADSGEAQLLYCECGWASNIEAAEAIHEIPGQVQQANGLTKISTTGIQTIADLAREFELNPSATVKTMAGKTPEGDLVFFCLPGDRELNPVKVHRAVPGVVLLEDEDFKAFDIPKGSLGPVNPPAGTLVFADHSLKDSAVWVVGANEEGYHFFGARSGHDFQIDHYADLLLAQPGDTCPACREQVLRLARGIEVSQVFQLGTKYSESMGAYFMSEDGQQKPLVMGCYGVGVTRSLAAVIEQHHDERGIVWPMSIAPLHVVVLPLITKDRDVMAVAESIWSELVDLQVETVIDDRNERAGVKFAESDLIGYPIQIVVGRRTLETGLVEVRERATATSVDVLVSRAPSLVADMVSRALESH